MYDCDKKWNWIEDRANLSEYPPEKVLIYVVLEHDTVDCDHPFIDKGYFYKKYSQYGSLEDEHGKFIYKFWSEEDQQDGEEVEIVVAWREA